MALEHVPGKNVADIKIYALSTCPWCKKTKRFLSDLGIEYYFEDVDLLNGEERKRVMEIVNKWNPNASFPTIVINDSKCIVGFNENAIKETLKL
jgi:glutaredoxin-like protein NrdH